MRGEIVEEEDSAFAAGKEVLQSENLPAIPQRALRQEPHFRKTVEYDAGRFDLAHLLEYQLRRLAQLGLHRMKQRELLIGADAGFRWHQLEDVHLIQGPAVASGDEAELRLAFGQGDIETLFAPLDPVQEKVESKRGLAGARPPLHQIQTVGIEAATENIVEAGKSRRYPRELRKAHGSLPIVSWRSMGR